MEQDLQARPLGLYIHIPWCLSHCGYCKFFTQAYSRKASADYFRLLISEKEKQLQRGLCELSTVYFGGGTPSLLSAQQISELLSGLPLASNAEITLEVNPIQITQSFANELRRTPVNRLSLGLQSMRDEELSYLQRKHRAADIPFRVKLLQEAGFDNISGDYIYGLPASTTASMCSALQPLLELPLQHISCYLLEIAEDSVLAPDIALLPSDDALAEQYYQMRKLTIEAGFAQYEISNFARPGSESRHNLLYWQGDDCLAWGASACGYYQGYRYCHPADLADYARIVCSGDLYALQDSEAAAIPDYIMMRLRLSQGLSLSEFYTRFGQDFREGRQIKLDQLLRLGLIQDDGENIRLSEAALFISNSVIAELL
ncbi:MAG: radical SAM family heme chaperone HemW [Candidatus Cloacimonetes bacterium]|nr:radical SAM family heme chaperone HemW [Candidatus Cloacimonadota bacterium]MCK9583934.1 radical SAM family heme chaperone HemW [Candidatus Cloacimonadota bacterium]MDY0229185.1 radical SAM family heme chaperone HemW [Candidatus Cloacimonadaceae bacterium]